MADPISRRDLLGLLLRRSSPGPAPRQAPPRPEPSHLPGFLRPPGASEEEPLVEACRRCGSCREACPHGAILPLGPAYGRAAGTPAVLPLSQACRLCDGLPCAAACPSGALKPRPVGEVRMGTARIDPARCWAFAGQPCDYCASECPVGPAALRIEDGRPRVDPSSCTGCGMCQWICTATPAAIRVTALTSP